MVSDMQSLKDPVRPPRISVTQSLMLLIRSSIDLADSVNAMLWAALCAAWFGFLYVSDFYLSIVRLRPSRASLSKLWLSTTNSIRLPRCSSSRHTRLILSAQRSNSSFRTPTKGSSFSHFLHHRGSLPGPVCVFSDGTPPPHSPAAM